MGIGEISNILWQGYRHKDTGIVIYYDSHEAAALPVRASVAKGGKSAGNDPHYESATYGLHSCSASRYRINFVKNKFGYVFFMTKYQGRNEKLKDKIMITGFYKIGSVADVQKMHLRYLDSNSCFAEKLCYALKAAANEKGESEAVFLSEEDAYVLNSTSLKSLGFDKKITKTTKIELNEEQTKKLLKKFEGKENKIADYIKQTKELP